MRKNNGGGKNLKSWYYERYKIEGLNLDRLINRLNKNGISVYNVKKKARSVIFSINARESEKVFAICKELCYNIIEVNNHGRLYPVVRLIRNVGVLAGVVAFIGLQMFFSDVCLSFEFSGNGNVYSREVTEYLIANGVKPMGRFSSFNMQTLEDRLLASSDKFSFVSCEKSGCRLKINLVLAEGKTGIMNSNVTALYSDVNGSVESVKVYRGTAEVDIGDEVKKGDLLVGGYAIIKEEMVSVNVLAVVTLKVPTVYTVILNEKGLQERAVMLAEEEANGKEILDYTVEEIPLKKGYQYNVTLFSRRIITSG